MCVRRYEDNWGELKGKLMERDVLEVLSFSAFAQDESDLEEKLRYCGEKDIHIQVKDARDNTGCVSGVSQTKGY